MTVKAIFLDKDGTLIEDVPYNVDLNLIRLTEGAVEGLHMLQGAGYLLIVVSNQSGIAQGFFNEQDVIRVKRYLGEMLFAHSIFLTGFYFCPHHPQGKIHEYTTDCFCRKPQPGMLYQAAHRYRIDLASSWLIGDILHDIEAGKRAGCRTILIDNGHETEWKLTLMRSPDFIVKNLHEAARTILWS
jgi:D-glycero-D-manno-heptose 1,7-bisphosphate phosphatase